ncbi:P-loop containing nucleoside triphosphate hydrolase protein [Dunaliella salina]|uniref:RNA helicase n=1 Tax=Dunaliella salina TaxID=3046 RepID=A0ABQ7GBR6_DUNSA|nr:P-loop containing nucleoside triphosphate hydrolase protein [Dunaliella salina]|eukprot:KAF5832054.1 P-loop containing nucleoside triphosphate hydrolase protein [Dunaliella salina]
MEDPDLNGRDRGRKMGFEVTKAGFTSPTPIQASAWPVLLGGSDIVAVSKTGSGKTCGFLLPGMMHIKKAGKKDMRQGPQLLVLAPTRECLSGGVPKGPQLRDLNTGVHLAIATPGRLNDFLEAGQVRLGQVSYLVLDEADRMLDMGFEPQIQQIVKAIPAKRQTVFFSATWPMAVRKIASQFVGPRTVHIFVGDGAGVDGKLVANKSITQYVKVVGGRNDKVAELQRILRSKPAGTRFMVFCKTKSMCDQLTTSLPKDLKSAALLATRFPRVEDYIHRIGRTGRAGAQGESHTFFTSDDAKHARKLSQIMSEVKQAVPPELAAMAEQTIKKKRKAYAGQTLRVFGTHSLNGKLAGAALKDSLLQLFTFMCLHAMSEANQAVHPELAAVCLQAII